MFEINQDKNVLKVTGGAGGPEVDKFAKKFESLVKGEDKVIVIDLTNAEFIDSHFLGLLIYNHSTLKKEERQLIVVNDNDDENFINKVFKMTNLYKVLKIVKKYPE